MRQHELCVIQTATRTATEKSWASSLRLVCTHVQQLLTTVKSQVAAWRMSIREATGSKEN